MNAILFFELNRTNSSTLSRCYFSSADEGKKPLNSTYFADEISRTLCCHHLFTICWWAFRYDDFLHFAQCSFPESSRTTLSYLAPSHTCESKVKMIHFFQHKIPSFVCLIISFACLSLNHSVFFVHLESEFFFRLCDSGICLIVVSRRCQWPNEMHAKQKVYKIHETHQRQHHIVSAECRNDSVKSDRERNGRKHWVNVSRLDTHAGPG